LVHQALKGLCTDSGILQVCSHYNLTLKDLQDMAGMIASALTSVRSLKEMEGPVQADLREMIMEYIRTTSGPRGVAVEVILDIARLKAVPPETVLAAIESLIVEDECYQPQKGYVKPL
ncbi:MAG: hypothetical protein LUQ69_06925, partial [Methanoregulaceae archaeon]|nr:hypothetical protein [Methanoregulaceae archaeon]